MGNTESTTSSAVVNNAIARAITTNMSECSSGARLEQDITLSGTTKFTGFKQEGVLTSSCVQRNASDQEIIQDIANEIAQEAAATSTNLIGVALGDTSANAISTITTNLDVAAINESMQQCSASLDMRQTVDASGYTVGVSVEQGADLYNTCVQENNSTQSATQSVVNDVDQEVEATTEDLLSSLFGDLATYIGIAIIVIVAIIVLAIVMKIIQSRKQQQQMMYPPMPPPGPYGDPYDDPYGPPRRRDPYRERERRPRYEREYSPERRESRESRERREYSPEPERRERRERRERSPERAPERAPEPEPEREREDVAKPNIDELDPHSDDDHKYFPGTDDIYQISANEVFVASTGEWMPYSEYKESK